MSKKLISLLLFTVSLISFSVHSSVKMKWLGVGAVLLDDGETKIMFDPAFTRPSLKQMLGLSEFRSDELLVKKILNSENIRSLDAVFVTHTHFDHAVDATIVTSLTNATLFADSNMAIIAKAHRLDIKMEELKKTSVGNFIVTPILRTHSKIFHLFDFLPGKVSQNFEFNFYDYRVGNTWIYLIEHPKGTILLDDSSGSSPKIRRQKIDVIIQGIANRKDDKDILDGLVSTFNAEKFIAIHFDNFFLNIDQKNMSFLPGVDLDGLSESFNSKKNGVTFIAPSFGEEIELF